MEILSVRNISKRFGRNYAVKDLSMTINKGDIYGFIGRNGAGKTTLIRILMGIAKENSGSIKFFGSDDLLKGRDKTGTIIENPGLFANMTGFQNLRAQTFAMDISKSDEELKELLKLVGLDPELTKKAKNYSLGMKQRLAIAVALVSDPEFLILDEPTNGLDPEGIMSIRNLILKLNREKGITVLVSSHILSELHKLATRYGIIDKGIMIEELTAEELDKRTKDAFELIVKEENVVETESILKKNFLQYNLDAQNGRFLIHNIEDTEKLIIELVENKIIPISHHTLNSDLEDYFFKAIGGQNNE